MIDLTIELDTEFGGAKLEVHPGPSPELWDTTTFDVLEIAGFTNLTSILP